MTESVREVPPQPCIITSVGLSLAPSSFSREYSRTAVRPSEVSRTFLTLRIERDRRTSRRALENRRTGVGRWCEDRTEATRSRSSFENPGSVRVGVRVGVKVGVKVGVRVGVREPGPLSFFFHSDLFH